MKVTISIHHGKTLLTTEREVLSKQDYLEFMGQVYESVTDVEDTARFIVLTGLKADKHIAYIKAIREALHTSLKDSKDLVDSARDNKNILAVYDHDKQQAVLRACLESGLGATRVTSHEMVCMQVHDS